MLWLLSGRNPIARVSTYNRTISYTGGVTGPPLEAADFVKELATKNHRQFAIDIPIV